MDQLSHVWESIA